MTYLRWETQALATGDLIGIGSNLLPQVATDVANRALELAPLYRMWRHTGELVRSIGWEIDRDYFGYYADVSAVWYGRFLDPKASQLHFLRPLLPSSLEIINGRRY